MCLLRSVNIMAEASMPRMPSNATLHYTSPHGPVIGLEAAEAEAAMTTDLKKSFSDKLPRKVPEPNLEIPLPMLDNAAMHTNAT